MRKKQLFRRWLTLLANNNSKNRTKIYHRLLKRYNEHHRFYHRLDHIEACLTHLDAIAIQLNNQYRVKLIELALWFHDSIYCPKKHNNEIKSANFASQCLKELNFNLTEIKIIKNYILLTAHPSQPSTKVEKTLVDIDLAILGATGKKFKQYEQQIRKEYQHLPCSQYQLGRKRVLQYFLQQSPLFKTKYFYQQFEQQAKRNLAMAITNLVKQS